MNITDLSFIENEHLIKHVNSICSLKAIPAFKLSILCYSQKTDKAIWTRDDLGISKMIIPSIIDKQGEKLFDLGDLDNRIQLGSKYSWYEDVDNEEQLMIINRSQKPSIDEPDNLITYYTFIEVKESLLKDKRFKEIVKEKNEIKFQNVLTSREIQVLKGICKGESITDIASRIFISRHTVISHKRNIGKKLDTFKSARMAAIGSAMGILI
jgi:DNA-binding CsgD family transcriptional regulator